MAQTVTFKQIGPSQALSVTAASAGPITLAAFNDSEPVAFAAFLNPSANPVAVQMGQKGTTPAAVFPAAGTPANTFVLPALMVVPMIVETPRGPFDFNAIALVAGPSLIYAWPVGPQ